MGILLILGFKGVVGEVNALKAGATSIKSGGKIAVKAGYSECGENTKDIYRAVSPEGFEDVMSLKKFRGIEGKTFAAKEFGNSFDETLTFANQSINRDKAAILKVIIPEDVYNQLHHMELDNYFF